MVDVLRVGLEVHHLHLVVAVAGVDADLVLEVLADLVAPGQRELPAPVVHLTAVHRCRLRTDGSGHILSQVDEHLAVLLVVVFQTYGQTLVQHLEVETDIGLVRLVPVYVGIHGRVVLVDGDTVAGVVASTCAEHDTAVGILGVDLHPLPGGAVVTTRQTPAGAELQEVDPFQGVDVLEPGLLADHPTC